MLSFVPEVTLLTPSIALSALLVTSATFALCILHTSTNIISMCNFPQRSVCTVVVPDDSGG